MSRPTNETDDGTTGTPLDDIDALRRELLRSRRDNAQFQLKVKNLSHALEGVQGSKHDSDLNAIRSFIVENRAVGPLVYEGVRVSVSSEPPVPRDNAAGVVRTLGGVTSLEAVGTQPQSLPTPHFVANSFAALDVSARLASAQAGRRPNVRGSGRAALVAEASGAVPITTSGTTANRAWIDDAAGSLPTPPRTIPPGVPRIGIGPDSQQPPQQPQKPQTWPLYSEDPPLGGADKHEQMRAPSDSSSSALGSRGDFSVGAGDGGVRRTDGEPLTAAPLNASLDEEDEEDDDDEEPPPPPLGSPSAYSESFPSAYDEASFGAGATDRDYFEPESEQLRPAATNAFVGVDQQPRRRHSVPVTLAGTPPGSPSDTTRCAVLPGLQ